MPYHYVKTGRPPGRPKKPATVLVSSALVPTVPPWEADVPETIEGMQEFEVPALTELEAKSRLIASSKQARLEHLAAWMLTTKDIRVAELLLRACGDLLPVQLLQQNNIHQAPKAPTSEGAALIQVLSNGRGPGEWAPPAYLEEPDEDPVLDAPPDLSPIPEPPEDVVIVEDVVQDVAQDAPSDEADEDEDFFESILAGVG